MKIGIDGNLLCTKRVGMAQMLLNTLRHWDSARFEKTVLFLPAGSDEVPKIAAMLKGIEICTVRRRSYPIWEQFVLPREARRLQLDCLWFPYNTGSLFWNKRMVVTIHDMIYMHGSFLQQPTLYKKCGQLYRKCLVPIVAKKADCIITSSQTSAREIASYCPYAAEKISVVYCSCESDGAALSAPDWEAWRRANGIDAEYILGVASIDERKNTLRIVKAFEQLCEEGAAFDLVLFGYRGGENAQIYRYIQASPWTDRIHVLGFVSDQEKNALLHHAKVFVFASVREGFGIPILEAYRNETVLVTSNVTGMPEIAGDAAVYVDPQSVDSICEGIKKALADSTREELVPKGRERAKLFTWDRVAEATMQAILAIDD